MGRFWVVCMLMTASLKASSQDSEVTLLSFPRSGNTWMRYCIETLTKRPTTFESLEYLAAIPDDTPANKPISQVIDLGADLARPFVFKKHNADSVTTEPMILLLRNPKESIITHLGVLESLFDKHKDFFENIEVYHKLNSDKIVVYYEDLMIDPKKELSRVMHFLSRDPELHTRLEAFMDNYEWHKNNCIQFYNVNMKPVQTADKNKLIYYSKNVSRKRLCAFDRRAKKLYPEIWDIYLKRYEEN